MEEQNAHGVDRIVVGLAQRPGTEPPCADGADVQRRGKMVCAAGVDGAGHHPDTVRYSALTPAVITHIGMTLGGLVGLMTAGQMAAAYDQAPHASAVYACMEPGQPTSVHWIGDCRAYGWREGAGLTLWSDDQTMGNWLRRNGGAAVQLEAEKHDNWSRLGVAQASSATCRQVQIPGRTPRWCCWCPTGSPTRCPRRCSPGCAASTRPTPRCSRTPWSRRPGRTRAGTATTPPWSSCSGWRAEGFPCPGRGRRVGRSGLRGVVALGLVCWWGEVLYQDEQHQHGKGAEEDG